MILSIINNQKTKAYMEVTKEDVVLILMALTKLEPQAKDAPIEIIIEAMSRIFNIDLGQYIDSLTDGDMQFGKFGDPLVKAAFDLKSS